jgi:Acetyl-coenzyme A transporter 1
MCTAAAGTCVMERDGYYITTGICLAVGLLFFVAYINPTAKRLQGLFGRRHPSSATLLLTCCSRRIALPLTKWRTTI